MLDEAGFAMHTSPHHTGLHYPDPMFGGKPLPSCDRFLRDNLEQFEYNQSLPYNDKMRADNDIWDTFNATPDHIFGVDVRLVPAPYKHYMKQVHGDREWRTLEARCERRANAELREIAALAKPSQAQTSWFKQRCDSGEKSGPELNGPLSEKNWLRRFIMREPTYLCQFPWTRRKTRTARFELDWWERSTPDMYVDEMSVCAKWMSMNALCKANLGRQCRFPYTDYQEVRVHRHFAYIRDNKTIQGVKEVLQQHIMN